jgi:hypothetical protein
VYDRAADQVARDCVHRAIEEVGAESATALEHHRGGH